jgi:hypothetical protein
LKERVRIKQLIAMLLEADVDSMDGGIQSLAKEVYTLFIYFYSHKNSLPATIRSPISAPNVVVFRHRKRSISVPASHF